VGAKPPAFLEQVASTHELTEEQFDTLQTWAVDEATLSWSTGIGLIDAAMLIVQDAVDNGNIGQDKFERPDDYDPANERNGLS